MADPNGDDCLQGRDLFTLPDVYTANAARSFIINNRFVPNVPEPSTFVLGTAGSAALGVVTLRKTIPRV